MGKPALWAVKAVSRNWLALAGVALALSPVAAFPVESIEVQVLLKDRVVMLIDGRNRTLKQGETSQEGVTLISSDGRVAILEVNGERNEYGLNAKVRTGAQRSPTLAKVLLPSSEGGHFMAVGSINGFSVQFIVDTGASFVSMNSRVANRIGIDYLIDGKEGRSITAAGTVRSWVVNLDRVRVGEIELRNVRGSVREKGTDLVLLGMSFLRRLHMEQDGDMLVLSERPY